MKKRKIRSMTITAMFIAILVVISLVQYIIAVANPLAFLASVTLLTLPVLVGAYVFGWKQGAIDGFAFGVLSFLWALIAPIKVLDPYFVNPVISVLPRLLFGLACGGVFFFVKKIRQKALRATMLAVSSFFLTILHSVLVLTTLGLFNGPEISTSFGTGYWALMGTVIFSNGLIEAALGAAIVPAVVFALQKAFPKLAAEKHD